jgi:hypothetical protein
VPTVASPTEQDRIQALQRTLYRAAKADPGRRFHALYDKVYRRDVLERAWVQVRRNGGAAGIDRTTIADVEAYGVSRLLDELAADLKSGSYRPLPTRRVFIPKRGSGERRPWSIPSVRDPVPSRTAPSPAACATGRMLALIRAWLAWKVSQSMNPSWWSRIRTSQSLAAS